MTTMQGVLNGAHNAYVSFNKMGLAQKAATVGGIGVGFSLIGGLGPNKVAQPTIGGTVGQAVTSGIMWGGINGVFTAVATKDVNAGIKAGATWAAVGASFVAGRAIGHEIDHVVGL